MKQLFENWRRYVEEINEVKHDCANHVKENATGREGECINHTLLEDGTVTHYTVEFQNEIVENIPVEALTVVTLNEHMHSPKRDDYDHDKKKPRRKYMEEEDIKNPGPYADGARAKAGVDSDGDGVPDGADEDPKDGSIKQQKKKIEFPKDQLITLTMVLVQIRTFIVLGLITLLTCLKKLEIYIIKVSMI